MTSVQLQDELKHLKQTHLGNPAPPLGRACRGLFGHDSEYIEFNNGSFGSCPNYVLSAVQLYQRYAERRPDAWHRGGYRRYLDASRDAVASLVNVDSNDLVLVNNTTTGVNAILRGLQGTWAKGDAILEFTTAYEACSRTGQYVVDVNHALELSVIKVPVLYPQSDEEMVTKAGEAIRDAQSRGVRVRIALIDAVSSRPGVVVPWRKLVQAMRSHGVLSLVDGAHAVGQIPLDLGNADPDFFVSNCHKWLMAHRGCAFLYVPRRNQDLVPSLPISHHYISPADANQPQRPPVLSTGSTSNFVASWDFTGTNDFSNYCAVVQALEFRQWLGGEEAIRNYVTTLAHRGGDILTSKLGTQSVIMGGKEGTAAMVNVSVPVRNVNGTLDEAAALLQTAIAENHPTFISCYAHNDALWVRVSAQVWLQEDDFEWLAGVLLDCVQRCGWELR